MKYNTTLSLEQQFAIAKMNRCLQFASNAQLKELVSRFVHSKYSLDE